MTDPTLGERILCAALMTACGVVMVVRPAPRVARRIWVALLIVGIGNALVLNLSWANRINSNLIHHYLGAKYAVPYSDFYRAVQAALARPQIGVRDLDHPRALVRSDPREQRAYYIDLLRAEHAAFNPLAPLDSLAHRAVESGAVARESDRILKRLLPADRVAPFRDDVRRAVAGLRLHVLTEDYGFNGSPFYTLLRRADPTLHRPFGPAAAWVDVIAQVLATLVIAWLVGAALALETHERMGVAALLFASWDVVGYAIPGLVHGELWVPVAVVALAMKRRQAMLAGAAVAWAGLIKLFPFVLLLPAVARPWSPRRGGNPPATRPAWWSLRFAGACAVATAGLAVIALASGRSWPDFLRKIVVEFQSESVLANSVSLGSALMLIGIHHSPLIPLLSLVALAALGAMFTGGDDAGRFEAMPRRAWILIGAMGWLTQNWLNYYVVAPLLLLPATARRHRVGALVATLGMSVSFLMPDYGDPNLLADAGRHAIKLLPYLLMPAWLVALELRTTLGGRARRAVPVVAALVALAVAAETWRMQTIQGRFERGRARLDQGAAAGALDDLRTVVRLSPHDATARRYEARALATLGRLDEAEAGFAHATRLEPRSAAAQDDYGRVLMMRGKTEVAGAHFEAARSITPWDTQILDVLAQLRADEGRTSEAIALLARARELDPDDPVLGRRLEALRNMK